MAGVEFRSCRVVGSLLRRLWLVPLCLGSATWCFPQDLPEIRKRGALRVVVNAKHQPERFALKPDDAPGLEKEILLGFAALHRLKLEVVVVDGGEDRIPALVEGKGDVIVGVIATQARRKTVDFTREVLPARHVVVTRKPAAPVLSLPELRKRRVGTLKDSSWAEEILAAGVPPANMDDSFTGVDKIIEGLAQRRISAAVMSVIWAVLVRKNDPDLELGLLLGEPTSVAYAVRKDSPQLLEALDDYVSNVRRTATWSRLVVKYFGESALEILKRCRADANLTLSQ